METRNLSTLKIHKLSQEQYLRELEAGNIDEYALYLTPSDDASDKQDKLVGVQGQVVGFDENGNAVAQDAVGKNVFTAIYGTTTFDEVQEAYDEGKTIILKEETPWEPGSETNSVYYLTYLADDSHALFIGSYYVESAYKSNPESACPYSEIYLVQLTASNEWSTITHRINPMHGATSSYDGHEGLVPAPTINDRNKFLKGDGTWGTLVPNKIALVATAGQTSFTIPFEYDSLSSNLTVYFNGILMKETDNYTVNTSNNTVNLVGFSAESGDIITIMGLLGAQSIDFSQEAIDAINRINAAVEKAEEDIDKKIQTAFEQIDIKIDEVEAFVEQLPDDVTKLMSKNTNNTLDEGYKITLTNVTPSAAGDVTTKQYVDEAISTATSNIVTDVFHRGTSAPSNTKLLWIDTSSGNGNGLMKYYNGSSWVAISAIWS